MQSVLAWTPFLDPLPAHSWWLLLIVPLVLGVSFAYKAVRVPELKDLPRETGVMFAQVLLGIFLTALGMYLVIEWLMPLYG
ncbi:MAG: hypothetical protein ACTS27_12045 [Phycisphaerales bacterium]